MRIDRPIFLLGPGRSGSTLLNNLVTHHRDVGYFISWSSRYPSLPFLSLGAWLRSTRLEKKGRRIRFYPGPTEPYYLWSRCFPRFWKVCGGACRDQEGAAKLRKLIAAHLRFQHRSRFVAKLTGPPMFEFLESIFPDARFVWVDRDPRAVSFSYYLRREIDLPGELSEDERLRRAAQRYLRLYDLLQTKDHRAFYTLLYEDFVEDPVPQMQRLLSFLDLREDRRLLKLTAEWPIRKDANRAWRERLDRNQQAMLEEVLARPLRERRAI